MDVDDDEDSGARDDGNSDEMDVDGEEQPSSKKVKTNSGAVAAKRMPRSDRTLAGLRDEAVSCFDFICHSQHVHYITSKLTGPQNCGISGNAPGICLPKLARATVRSESKWSVLPLFIASSSGLTLFFTAAQAPICWQTKGGKDRQKMKKHALTYTIPDH